MAHALKLLFVLSLREGVVVEHFSVVRSSFSPASVPLMIGDQMAEWGRKEIMEEIPTRQRVFHVVVPGIHRLTDFLSFTNYT